MENQYLHIIYIHLGTNQGEREKNLEKAIELINFNIGEVGLCSKLYETAAWGNTAQPDFLNQAIEVKTTMFPIDVMNALLSFEKRMGRERKKKWGPRIIDLDMMFYDDYQIDSEILIIPHPRLHIRNFVLIPLMDIIPDFIHPKFKQTIRELKGWCQDDLDVKPYRKR